MRSVNTILLLLFSAFLSTPCLAQHGTFSGELVVVLEGPRNARLLTDFSYTDPNGERWTAPKNAIVDGASIPRVFWSAGSPWVGPYRQASVIHDYYCVTKVRPWKEVHRMFYNAALAGGTSASQ
ncbi:DUF1353 domain-containing protein [Aquibium oceanicum]|uniref:DUF1353 domain-containing protein n=1 Tax=Aquibium oceanicum TaxID=1670800 RepID=A0A1L3SPB7_9HYPH|nr:DUF1353 domain-containing protein [Aquibium oceanicum]APH71246.1 hypothetical protein BSQ44_07555 [Aquibium oceanicum]